MKIKSGVKPSLPPVPGGTYLAVCVYSIAIGEQLCEYKDKGKSYNNQVMLGFELMGVTAQIDGKEEPRTLGRTFNIAKSKNSALRKFVSAWDAKEYTDDEFLELDTNDLVGKPAMLNVVLNETGEYANIESIMQIPAGFPTPQATLPLMRFDMEPWDQKAFEALPEWAQERIKKSSEWQKEHAPTDKIGVQPTVQAPQTAQQMTGQTVTARRDPTQMVEQGQADSPKTAAPMGNPLGSFAAVPPSKGDLATVGNVGAVQADGGCPI